MTLLPCSHARSGIKQYELVHLSVVYGSPGGHAMRRYLSADGDVTVDDDDVMVDDDDVTVDVGDVM